MFHSLMVLVYLTDVVSISSDFRIPQDVEGICPRENVRVKYIN
jgi:hypothetical protein